ncbi:MAG TPA: EpsI family protein [Armatimonadota bacterium]
MDGRVSTDFAAIPMSFDKWEGIQLRFDKRTYEALPTCSLLLRDYITKDEPSMVELAIVYGRDLGDFHQPEYCLEGQGLKAVREFSVTARRGKSGNFDANALIMVDGNGNRWAYMYWFYTRGRTGTQLGSVKVREFVDRLKGRTMEPSAMIRLMTKAVDSDDKAITRLTRFAESSFPYLEKELAGDTSGN